MRSGVPASRVELADSNSVAAAACVVPLRRALRVEPTEALRVT
jgi:hypothetical protein